MQREWVTPRVAAAGTQPTISPRPTTWGSRGASVALTEERGRGHEAFTAISGFGDFSYRLVRCLGRNQLRGVDDPEEQRRLCAGDQWFFAERRLGCQDEERTARPNRLTGSCGTTGNAGCTGTTRAFGTAGCAGDTGWTGTRWGDWPARSERNKRDDQRRGGWRSPRGHVPEPDVRQRSDCAERHPLERARFDSVPSGWRQGSRRRQARRDRLDRLPPNEPGEDLRLRHRCTWQQPQPGGW